MSNQEALYQQNLATDPRLSVFVNDQVSQLRHEIAELIRKHDETQAQLQVSSALASLVGNDGWAAMKEFLKARREEIKEALAAFPPPYEGLVLQVRAAEIQSLLDLVTNAPNVAYEQAQELERTKQQAQEAESRLRMEEAAG